MQRRWAGGLVQCDGGIQVAIGATETHSFYLDIDLAIPLAERPVDFSQDISELGALTFTPDMSNEAASLSLTNVEVIVTAYGKRTDALQALESLEAAFDQTLQARENVRLAETLRDAEARRFASGLSNLIDVNIREVQAATAARQLVDAQAAYFRSLADYRARIARPPDGEPTGAAAPMTFDS